MPIRLRLTIVGAGVAGLALLLFGLLFDRLAVIGVSEDQDRHLSGLATHAVGTVMDADPSQLVPTVGCRRCSSEGSERAPIRSSPWPTVTVTYWPVRSASTR
jgi:hypothetical protein